MKNIPAPLSHDETIELVKIHKYSDVELERDRAREKIISSNLRLVSHFAKKFSRNDWQLFEDLLQEGSIGLSKALEKFDETKGFKFSTYASWWIRQAIQRYLQDHSRTIRIPVHAQEQINKIHKAKRELYGNNEEELVSDISDMTGMTDDKIEEMQVIGQHIMSLSDVIGEDGTLEDILISMDTINPEEESQRASEAKILNEILSELDPKEERVIRMRFGIGVEKDHTLEDIARQMDLTRERIRQIENKALNKLKRKKRKIVESNGDIF